MINKGRIVFINGYWMSGPIGRLIIRSQYPKERYWLHDFEKSAESFFGLNEPPNTHKYLDASSLIGIDMGAADRYKKAFSDYDYEADAVKQVIFTPGEKIKNEMRYKNFEMLTADMDKTKHCFYLITHSEGGAYGAGLAQLLINKGWKVKMVIHLSTDEANDFDTPDEPLTYQLGYTARKSHKSIAWGDWVTSNYQIRKGVDKWGIVYKDLSGVKIHHKSRCGDVFISLSDLQTLEIQPRLGTDNKPFFEQVPESTPNGTIFTIFNGTKLRYSPVKAQPITESKK
jgi:hypothetical protein